MKTLAAAILASGLAICGLAVMPAWAGMTEDRAACANATAENMEGLLACVKGLNERLIDIEDEPEEIEPPDDTDDRLTALEDQLKAAQAENAKLTDQVAVLTAKVAEKPKYKIPFVVEDEAGAAVFTVDSDGAEHTAVLGDAGGDRVRLATGGGKSVLSAVQGDQGVVITASGEANAVVMTDGSRGTVGVGHLSNGYSGLDYRQGSSVLASVGGTAGTDAALKIFTSAGKPAVFAGTEAGSMRLRLGEIGSKFALFQVTDTVAMGEYWYDDKVVRMGSSADGAFSRVISAPYSTEIKVGGDFAGLLLRFADKDLANLGVISGRGAALRVLNKEGKTIAAMGAKPDGGGSVQIGNGSMNAVQIDSDSSAAGSINVFGGGDSATVALIGKENLAVVYGDNGVPLATMMKSTNSGGGNFTARNLNGDGVFSAGYATNGGGEACVWRSKNGQTSCLGIGLPGMGQGK